MDTGATNEDNQALHGSCAARVLILIDTADFAAKNGAGGSARDAAICVDSVRLSVLRVLLQLCRSCPQDSWLEWATRFFDSRHGGVGKTPSELRARLRSRLTARPNRGFTRVTQESFQAFGEACLAVSCGVQGDPLARDLETALKRWVHRRKERGSTRIRRSVADCEVKPHSGDQSAPEERFGGPRSEASGDEGPRRMYAGHDMSSHEVVVRSLLEVLQEFGEAGQRVHTGASSMSSMTLPLPGVAHDPEASRPQQLLLLHGGCPSTDHGVESFVLRGNFTPEAEAFEHKSPEERAEALMEMLNAQLGKAILSIGARGVSFIWQDGFAKSDVSSPLRELPTSPSASSIKRKGGCLHRCLLAAGGRGVIGLGRVTGSSVLLPPSAALGRHFTSGYGDGQGPIGSGEANTLEDIEEGRGGTTVGVALNPKGIVDVHVVSTPLSARRCYSGHESRKFVETAPSCATKTAPQGTPRSTPWRLMGTVSVSQVWPGSLVDQGWGSAAVMRGRDGPSCERWREFLCELRARDLAAVTTLPLGLFRRTSWTHGSHGDDNEDIEETPTVALIVPVTEECALGWSMEVPEVDAEAETEAISLCVDDTACASRFSAQSQVLALEALESMGVMGEPTSEEERENAHPESQEMRAADSVGGVAAKAGMVLERRENEVASAIQEASLERKRRRQRIRRGGLEAGARSLDNIGSSASGVAYRGGWSGGTEGSLRESVSRCSAGEATSCDRVADSIRQWRLEAFSETSRVSGSPRGCRLFASDTEITEDDERASRTESTPGPRRALEQVLEDVSSRSSLLVPDVPDADSSSTFSSREGSRNGATVQRQRVERAIDTRSRVSEDSTKTAETSEPLSLVDFAGGGARELPLSFMSEPALACLPGPPLGADVLSLGKTCARTNENAADSTVVAVRDAFGQFSLFPEAPQHSRVSTSMTPQGVGARQKFIDIIRYLERMERVAEADRNEPVEPPFPARITTPAVPVNGDNQSRDTGDTGEALAVPQDGAVPEAFAGEGTRPPGDERFCNLGGEHVEVAGGFEHRVTIGVCGLLKQYREVVEGGQRSPVDFVVHAVPEAVRDLTDDGRQSGATDATDDADDADRHARAAQVLAAVVSGLSCTPRELSLKHLGKKGSRPAAEEAPIKTSLETSLDRGDAGDRGKGAVGTKGAVAKPAIQKIRDYQLQALLLCQFHTLAMDLPDTPESIAVFASLEASGRDKMLDDPGSGGGDSKRGKVKGKGKKRRRKSKKQDQQDHTGAPVRPFDPLPDHRRARLVDLLQPISTLLESRTIVGARFASDEGAAETVAVGSGGTNGSRSRAYDGTLADFMGLALVKNFGPRLPRTLLALYEDFEYHPPDALGAMIVGACQGNADAVDAIGSGVGVATSGVDGLEKIRHNAAGDDSSGTGTGTGTTEAGTEPGGFGPRATEATEAMATAGILLSDRTPMSHNHFKNSGVLNGFPKVKLKSKVINSLVGSGAPGNDRTTNTSGESGSGRRIGNAKWRHARGKIETTSRMARDTKQEAGRATRDPLLLIASEAAPSEGVRDYPRLVRHLQNEATFTSADNSKARTNASGKRRSSFSCADALSHPAKTRRLAAPTADVPRSRSPSSVLVGETPRKGSARKHRLRDGAALPAHGHSFERPVDESRIGDSKSRTPEASAGQFPDSPSGETRNSVTAADPATRQRALDYLDYASPQLKSAKAKKGGMPSPASRGAASAATRLFVAESPGAGVPVEIRRALRSVYSGGDVGGVCNNLMSDSASPAPQRRSVVPDTPA